MKLIDRMYAAEEDRRGIMVRAVDLDDLGELLDTADMFDVQEPLRLMSRARTSGKSFKLKLEHVVEILDAIQDSESDPPKSEPEGVTKAEHPAKDSVPAHDSCAATWDVLRCSRAKGHAGAHLFKAGENAELAPSKLQGRFDWTPDGVIE